MTKKKKQTKCGYERAESPCSGALSFAVQNYFINGESLYLCGAHGLEWLHFWGPCATANAKGTK